MATEVIHFKATADTRQAEEAVKRIGTGVTTRVPEAGKNVDKLTVGFTKFGGAVKTAGREVAMAVPQFALFARMAGAGGPIGIALATIGAATIGAAVGANDLSKRITQIAHRSREFGMSTKDINAYISAIEQTGGTIDDALGSLQGFTETMQGLKNDIGGARTNLSNLGLDNLVRRLMSTKDAAKQLDIATRFLNTITDPLHRRVVGDALKLSYHGARVEIEALNAARLRAHGYSAKEIADAKAYNEQWQRLSDTLTKFKHEVLGPMIPMMTQMVEESRKMLQGGGKSEGQPFNQQNRLRIPPIFNWLFKGKQGSLTGGEGNATMQGSAGRDLLEDTTEEGTFQALVKFAAYQAAGAGGGQLGSGSVAGSGGPSASGQGQGPDTPPSPSAPAGAQVAPQPGQGTGGPLGLPAVPGAPGATAPGQGTGGPLGLPMVPGAPGVTPTAAAPSAPSGGGRVKEIQGSGGHTRNQPIRPELRSALEGAAEELGLEVRVHSGGQPSTGGPRVRKGSHRHDEGHAADFKLYDKDGKVIPSSDPRAAKFAEAAARRGVRGGGAGYRGMGRESIHLDTGRRGGPYGPNEEIKEAIRRGSRMPQVPNGQAPAAVATPQPPIADPGDRADKEKGAARRGPDVKKMTREELNAFMGGGGDAPAKFGPPVPEQEGAPDPRFGGEVPFGPPNPREDPTHQLGRGPGGLSRTETDPTIPGGIPWMNEMQRRKFLTEHGATKGTEGTGQDPDIPRFNWMMDEVEKEIEGGKPASWRLDQSIDAQAGGGGSNSAVEVNITSTGAAKRAPSKTELFGKSQVSGKRMAVQTESVGGIGHQ